MPMKSNLRNRTAVRNPFTLLELVVVISILALASTFAVATFRGESPARQMENASLQFEAFCAKVRFNAMENGEDRIVLLNPDTRQFLVKIPEEFQEKENEQSAIGEISTANPNGDGDGKIFLPKWTLPEEFSLERADFDPSELSEDGTLELFRFFPDGGASGRRTLELKYKNLRRTFDISPLTGLITSKEEDLYE